MRMRAQCSVAGCKRDHRAAGFCEMHYRRQLRHGSIDATRRERGTGTINSHGYIVAGVAKQGAHRAVAERAIGGPLPPSAEVHHINGDRTDNSPSNLVICPSRAYHKLLHTRERALDECGHAGWRKCPLCGAYDDPARMSHNASSRYFYHPLCRTSDNRSRKEIR